MKKKLLLRLCLILMVAFTISSCRTDHLNENETTYNNSSKFQLTSKRISLNEAKHKDKLVTELDKAEAKFKNISKMSVNGKVIDYGDGVSIDTDDVIYIENGPNYHTYTFNIKRENAPADAPLENLLLTPLPDGTYKEFLIRYNLTENEKIQIQNNEFVDTNNKTQVIDLSTGNNSNVFGKYQSCSYEAVTVNVSCASGDHMPGQKGCTLTGDNRAKSYSMVALVCTSVDDDNGGGGGAAPGSGSSGGGGGGEPCTDCPPEQPSEPCTAPEVPTSPLEPSLDPSLGGGCGSGIPTQPNLSPPDRTTPCEKTKVLLADPAVQAKINELKEQSKIEEGQPGFGEKAFEVRNDGTSSDIIIGDEHQVNIGSTVGNKGVYHNHTPDGIKMPSPPDILKMLDYALSQPNANISNGFLGLVGSEVCSTCPGGYKYHNYVIRFSGTLQELGTFTSQNWDEVALDETYTRRKRELSKDANYADYKYGPLNSDGLEKLFFDTLQNMGMEGKVNLQRIEDNGTVQNITQNSNGTTSATPCP